MFVNYKISRNFALISYKIKLLIDGGFIKETIKNELHKIISDNYFCFYSDSNSIVVYEDEKCLFELRLIKNQSKSSLLSTHPNEVFIYPIVGEINISEYNITKHGEIINFSSWDMEISTHLIGKTSKTKKFYDFIPKNGNAIILFGYSKTESDDIYITYNKDTRKKIDVISSSLVESRLEFWMSFYPSLLKDIDNVSLKKLIKDSETRKLKDFLINGLKL